MRVNAQERDRFRAAVGGVRDSMERDYLSNGLQDEFSNLFFNAQPYLLWCQKRQQKKNTNATW